jgi:hypothetical protein
MVRHAAPLTLPGTQRLVLELLASQGPMYGLQLVEASRGRLKRGTVGRAGGWGRFDSLRSLRAGR